MSDADITLDGDTTVVDGHFLLVRCWDIKLDSLERRLPGAEGERRALVHGHGDELVINFLNDYPGGTVVHGDVDIHRGGELRIHHDSGRIEINNRALGDIALVDKAGRTRVQLTVQGGLLLRNAEGELQVLIDAKDLENNSWPAWKGEPSPTYVDLVEEVRRLKQVTVGKEDERLAEQLAEVSDRVAALERDATGRRVP